MKMFWTCPHPQAIQDVDAFVSSSDLEKCSIPSFAQHPLQWMGAIRMYKQLIAWHHKNPNPHHSGPSINIMWIQKLHVWLVRKRSIKMFLTFKNSSTSWEWVHFQLIDYFFFLSKLFFQSALSGFLLFYIFKIWIDPMWRYGSYGVNVETC